MQLTNPEKLILLMLSEFYQALDIRKEVDPEFVKKAIFTNNLWAFDYEFDNLFEEDTAKTPNVVGEVMDILEMWSRIEDDFPTLSTEDQERVQSETKAPPHFSGFDGNSETTQWSIARFFVEQLHRFQKFSGRELNSHYPYLSGYRWMYSVYEPMRPTLAGRHMTATELIQVLNALRRR